MAHYHVVWSYLCFWNFLQSTLPNLQSYLTISSSCSFLVHSDDFYDCLLTGGSQSFPQHKSHQSLKPPQMKTCSSTSFKMAFLCPISFCHSSHIAHQGTKFVSLLVRWQRAQAGIGESSQDHQKKETGQRIIPTTFLGSIIAWYMGKNQM